MCAVIFALFFVLALGSSAEAFIVVAAAVAAAGITGVAATVATIIGTTAIMFAASYVAQKLIGQPDQPSLKGVGGVELDIKLDAGVPRSILFGTAATAGSLAYVKTYGSRGEIDNSDAIEMIVLADHPCEELVDVFVDGKKQEYTPNLSSDKGGTREGMRITDYKRKLFFKFYDGTQTSADDLAVVKLSDGAHPWTSTMIGQGMTYVRAHAIYHPTLVTGLPQWKFVVKGIKLYDPRKDTTAGGSGSHRFTTLSTHAWTDNVAVMIYNILRGIYVADGSGTRQHFYGFKKTAADQLPFSVWVAAMNACDEDISAADNTNRYRAGGEISVDIEPRDAIGELLKCCGGRLVEMGGVYKLYIDVPELPVLEFTDDTVLDKEDTFKPVLPLEQRINYITGRYTSPRRWADKIAAPRTDAAFETEDGRRLTADLVAPMVQYTRQMQLLMKQYLKRSRRSRKHVLSLPPLAFHVEPGQVVSWTSERNNYTDKLFEVDSVEYHGNLCVTLSLTEVDPADYDWSDADDLDEDDDELPTNIPGPKVVSGFDVLPTIDEGDDGTRRPAFRVTWTPPDDSDASRLAIQIRRTAAPIRIWNSYSSDPEEGSYLVTGILQPNTNYDLRVRFESQSDYESDWTAWATFKTLNIKLTTKDFTAGLKAELETGINARIASIKNSLEIVSGLLAELQSGVDLDIKALTQQLIVTKNQITTAYNAAIAVAVGPNSSIGQAVTSLESQVGEMKAAVKAQFVTAVKPDFAIAYYELMLTALQARAGMALVAKSVGGVATGEIWFDAANFMIGVRGENGTYRPPFVVQIVNGKSKVLIDGEIIALSLKAARASIGTLSAIVANLGTVTAGRLKFDGPAGQIDISSNPLRILISKWVP